MTSTEIEQFLDTCRWIAKSSKVDVVIKNHARGILIRWATSEEKIIK